MPIAIADAQNHHPIELTRQASPEIPMLDGEFTLADLATRYGLPDGTEAEILTEAAHRGHAFFKSGDIYIGFAPQPGDSDEVVPDMASATDSEIFDDATDPDDEEIDVDGDEVDDEEGGEDGDVLDDGDEDEEDGDLPESLAAIVAENSPEVATGLTTLEVINEMPEDAPDDNIF